MPITCGEKQHGLNSRAALGATMGMLTGTPGLARLTTLDLCIALQYRVLYAQKTLMEGRKLIGRAASAGTGHPPALPFHGICERRH